MNDVSKIGVALLAGVAIGAVVGILLAPDKGAETRSKLRDLLNDLGGKLKDFSEEEAEHLQQLKGSLKTELNKKT
ncbi:MAG: YtxH domain-containing protein [Sphingobacteriaceae bacterium]